MVHHGRFNELCFGDGSGQLEDRLLSEDGCAFRDGVHVAGEAEPFQVLKKPLRKSAERCQIVERGVVKPERLEETEDIVESARQEIVAARGQSTDEQTEHSRVVHLLFEIGLEHRELIQVGEERGTHVR